MAPEVPDECEDLSFLSLLDFFEDEPWEAPDVLSLLLPIALLPLDLPLVAESLPVAPGVLIEEERVAPGVPIEEEPVEPLPIEEEPVEPLPIEEEPVEPLPIEEPDDELPGEEPDMPLEDEPDMPLLPDDFEDEGLVLEDDPEVEGLVALGMVLDDDDGLLVLDCAKAIEEAEAINTNDSDRIVDFNVMCHSWS